MSSSQVSDYTILPLALPQQSSLSFPKPATHTIYLRPHAPKIPTESDSRSLFLVNVPIDSTEAHLRAVFVSLVGAGRFESVHFEGSKKPSTTSDSLQIPSNKKRKRGSDITEDQTAEDLPEIWDRELLRSGGTAVVTLVDDKSVESTLKAIRKLHKATSSSKSKSSSQWPIWGSGVEGTSKVPALGSARYAAHHALRFPDPAILKAHVDEFMTSFNQREEEAARLAKKMRNVPDEDGFVTVSRGGRTGPARREEAERKRIEMEEKDKADREGRQGFYRFQVREQRKKEQEELVKRFDADRKKVEELKERRGRFRPER